MPPNFDWLADTGATSHMTPHRHWVPNYSPLRIPIRLADNTIALSICQGWALSLNGKSLFCAPICSDNCTVLSGSSKPVSESANWVSTLSLTPSLWHCCCCHHNLADIAKMQKDTLVTGMTFASSHKPDIVCEPCLAGKMHCNPFPSSPLSSTKPTRCGNQGTAGRQRGGIHIQ